MSRASRVASIAGLLLLASACAPEKKSEKAAPVLELSTGTLAFAAAARGASPEHQVVTVTNAGTGALALPTATVAYASGAGWLSTVVTGSEAPYHVVVVPSVAGLGPGSYAATLTVASAGAVGAARTVAVTFAVGAEQPAVLSLSAAGPLSFTAVEGGAAPAAQTLLAANAGSGYLAMPTASVSAWTGGGAGWLTPRVTGFAAPYTVSARPSPAGLLPGTYGATVSVASAGALSSPRTFAVSFTVIPKPAIALSAASIGFTARPGGAAPAAQTVTVTNGRTAPVGPLGRPTATVAYGGAGPGGWLSAQVAPGTSEPYTVTLTATPGALAPGLHTATVSIDAPNVANGPQVVSVTLDLRFAYTVFVYGHADHNLSTSLVADLAEMDQAALGPDVAVVVAADWSHGRTAPDGTPFPAGTEWYRIVGGGQPPVLVGTGPEQSFDDPAVLQASLASALGAYPADRYGVVLWDHGGSWAGGFGGDENDTPGDPTDDGAGMSATQAASAISAALAGAGVTGARPLEFLGYDTCLMAGNEVAWEARDLAKVYLADAEIDFGAGWDYAAALGWLAANPTAPAADFAAAEVAAWDAQHAAGGLDDEQLRSHVALDLVQFDAYATAWGALSGAMTAATSTLDWLEVGHAQLDAVPGYGSTFDAPSDAPELRDAGQLLARLETVTSDAAVASAAQQARTALGATVLAASNGALRTGQAGLHLEAPLAASWAARRGAYVGLGWNGATGWAGALDALAAASDAVAPVVTTVLANGTDPTAALPPTVTLSAPEPDVAEARVWLTETIAGSTLLHGIVAAGSVQPGASYDFAWDGRYAALGDGTAVSPVTLLPWIRAATPVYVFPALVAAPTGPVEVYGIADLATGLVSALLVDTGGRLAAFEVADFRGLAFTPLLWDVTAEGWVAGTALLVPDAPGATLALGTSQAPAGGYALLTEISDVWGNAGWASDAVTVVTPF